MSYKADKKKAKDDFSPIEAGEYVVALIDFEKKKTSNDDPYISAQFAVAKGKSKGRRIWENFLLDHPNEKAQEIAERKLQQLMFAVDVMELKSKWDFKPLIGKKAKAIVTIEENKKYGDKNRIVRFVSGAKKEKKGKKGKKHDVPF